MSSRLRNITITLEEDLARWARVEAARRDTSVSRFLAGVLKEQMSATEDYQRSMREALARQPFLNSDVLYLTREESHDRERFR